MTPTSYSFNLDGTCIDLMISRKATNTELTLWHQVDPPHPIAYVDGAAGVTGSGFIVLRYALLGRAHPGCRYRSDRFIFEARALTNLIWNWVATIVVARSEGRAGYAAVAAGLMMLPPPYFRDVFPRRL